VSWDGSSAYDMKAQIFTQAGAKVGSEFTLNARTDSFQEYGDIAALEGGGFVATWRTTNTSDDGSGYAIKARIFDAAGAGGAEFLVNGVAAGDQLSSIVAALPGGGFVIVWCDADASHDGSGYAVKAQRFDAAGAKLGDEFLVNTETSGFQSDAAVAVLPSGRFVITWTTSDIAQDGSGHAVKGQAYEADGTPIEGEFLVNELGSGSQTGSDLAALPGGRVLAVWQSTTGDASGSGIRARVLNVGDAPVITSGEGADYATVTASEHGTAAALVEATDPDGAAIVYSLSGGADAALFAIDPKTGVLRFLAAPDFEAPRDADGDNYYEVVVTASDGTMSDTQDLSIQVTDIDETPRTGTDGRDLFRLDIPGHHSAYGLDGVDSFYFGAAFTGADFVDGGANRDSLVLQGDYRVTFARPGGVSSIVGVESISLLSGLNRSFGDVAGNSYSYDLTMIDGNVAAGALMKVNGFHLQAGEDFRLDGSRETDAALQVFGGLGTDTLIGGAMGDVFIFGHDNRFAPGDSVTGGGGYDVLYLRGDYDLDFRSFTGALTGVESIGLLTSGNTEYLGGGDGDFDYRILWNDDLLDRGATMTINGSRLQAHETMVFDGSAETFGTLRVFGGAGDDELTGGAGRDQLHGGGGADLLRGGYNGDVFRYSKTSDSTAAARDRILDFKSDDTIDLSGIDAIASTEANEAFVFIKGKAFTAGGPGAQGEVRAYNAYGSLWIVEADVNGDGFADFVIEVQVENIFALSASDFIL
jgi:Ca2+-binding RTX toxin-like protein